MNIEIFIEGENSHYKNQENRDYPGRQKISLKAHY
jgi:hypothetical protein